MFRFPFTNFHELNLDWILSVVKEAKAVFDNGAADIQHAVDTSEEALQIAEQSASAQIGDGAVTTPKLADNAVNSSKLDNNAVTTGKINDGAVTLSKLATPLQKLIIAKANIPIPTAGNSQAYTLLGLTAEHVVIHWGFSSSPENDPPCDLVVTTAQDSFTVYNNAGTTSESFHPVFATNLN